MGYYSSRDAEIIKPERVEDFKRELNKMLELPDKKQPDWVGYFYYDGVPQIENDGSIELADHFCKWYDSHIWAVCFSPFAEKQTIEFVGEDGERWGFYFDGKGKVYAIRYEAKRGELLE